MKIRYLHKYFGVVMVMLVSLLLGFSSHRMAYAQTQIELVSTTYSTQSSLWGSWIQHWGKELEKRTNGQVRIKEYFWSGSLLQAAATTEGVGKGMADIGFAVVGYNPASYPLTLSALNIAPYAMGPAWVVPHVINELWDEYAPFRQELHDLNLEYLFNICGAESVIGSTKVIRNIEDLKGGKDTRDRNLAPNLKETGCNSRCYPCSGCLCCHTKKTTHWVCGISALYVCRFPSGRGRKAIFGSGFWRLRRRLVLRHEQD